MANAPRARKGYWRYDPSHRLGGNDETVVVDGRACPYCAEGVTRRVSERSTEYPYHWHPIGFRCSSCGTMFVDMEVKL